MINEEIRVKKVPKINPTLVTILPWATLIKKNLFPQCVCIIKLKTHSEKKKKKKQLVMDTIIY